MIRRLIRWLARKEIDAAYEAAANVERGLMELRVEARCAVAKATGELEGMNKAFASIEEEIRLRDGAYVCRCQIEKVKARLTLH
jgi:hypothetical protein